MNWCIDTENLVRSPALYSYFKAENVMKKHQFLDAEKSNRVEWNVGSEN